MQLKLEAIRSTLTAHSIVYIQLQWYVTRCNPYYCISTSYSLFHCDPNSLTFDLCQSLKQLSVQCGHNRIELLRELNELRFNYVANLRLILNGVNRKKHDFDLLTSKDLHFGSMSLRI